MLARLIILYNFIWQHFSDDAHIYIISVSLTVSIKRILISQLKKNLFVKFMFPPQFNV